MTRSKRSLYVRSAGKLVAQSAILLALFIGAVGITTTGPAAAEGKSKTIFNCYTQWWNTAWAQRCDNPGSEWAGVYRSGIICSLQGTRTITVVRAQHDRRDAKGPDCTFSASNGTISYNTY